MATPMDWEYRAFNYEVWRADEVWAALDAADKYSEILAREYFWNSANRRINAELQKYAAKGWTLEHPIGPQSIIIRQTEHATSGINGSDILAGILTLGLYFLVRLFANNPHHYTIYTPASLPIRLRRPRAGEIGAT